MNSFFYTYRRFYSRGLLMALTLLALLCGHHLVAQQAQDQKRDKAIRESEQLLYKANAELDADKFEDAEVSYREAISKNADNATARYNLGNAYYRRENLGEAFSRYKQAGEIADSKEKKHQAYHNLGNVFMKNKEYQKAVEAYKEALRNNPSDEETRYNFALAKEMLKNDQNQQDQNQQNQNKGGGDDNKEQNKDQQEQNKDQGDQGDNKDSKEQDQNKEQGDQGDQGDKEDQDEQGDKGEQGDNEEQQGDKGDEESAQNGQDKEQEGEPKEEGQGAPQQGKSELSPQQIKALLEAMGREEQRVQDRINAKKASKAKTSSEKDW